MHQPIPTATYKGATYRYQPALREIVITPPDSEVEIRFPVCREAITKQLGFCATELHEFWKQLLLYA